MPYYLVKDFVRGIDTRRMVETTEAGSLIRGENIVITRGGEIERRKAWLKAVDLPPNTYGLYCDDVLAGQFNVWTSEEIPASEPNVIVHQLVHPEGLGSHNLWAIRSVRLFNERFYVVAEWSNGDIINYYDGIQVVDDPPPEPEEGEEPGQPVPNPNPVGADRATATVTMLPNGKAGTTVKIYAWRNNGGSYPTFNYVWYSVNDPTTGAVIPADTPLEKALSIMAESINAYTPTDPDEPKFNASYDKTQLFVSFAERSAEYNGYTLSITMSLNEFIISPVPATFIGGRDVTESAMQNSGRIRDVGQYFSPGRYALQHKYKMYAVNGVGAKLRYSAANDPSKWNPEWEGAGEIEFQMTGGRSVATVMSLASFQDKFAIFAAKAVHLWRFGFNEEPPSEIAILKNTGTLASRSVQEYGNTDVFYLDQSGIRSLQSRDLSGEAFASDVGNPIDDLVREAIQGFPNEFFNSVSIVDPDDGRYVLAIGRQMFVFNFFAKTKISAWTIWTVDFDVTEIHADSSRMYARDADAVYSYGNPDPEGEDYDDCPASVQLPYLHTGKPAHQKDIHGLDVAVQNTWFVEFGLDYSNIDLMEPVGLIGSTTFREQKIPMQAYGTHVSFKLTCTEPGYARLGNLAFHYREGEEPG